MLKKSIKLVCLAFVFIIALTGCKKENVGPEEDNPVIEIEPEKEAYLFGYSCPNIDNPYYYTLKKVIAETLEEEGHKLIVKDPDNSSDKQIEQIREMIEKGIDVLILAPVDREAITPALELLDEADVKVVNVDTQVKEMKMVDAYVGSDNERAGRLCGKDMIERFPEGGKILILECENINSINERIRGFELSIASKGFEVVGRKTTVSDITKSSVVAKKLLEKNPDVQAVMCGNDRIALGVLKAVKELHLKDVCIYGIDGSPEVKKELVKSNSHIVATVGQSMMDVGRTAVNVGLCILQKEDYEEETYEEPFLITAENINMYGVDGWN